MRTIFSPAWAIVWKNRWVYSILFFLVFFLIQMSYTAFFGKLYYGTLWALFIFSSLIIALFFLSLQRKIYFQHKEKDKNIKNIAGAKSGQSGMTYANEGASRKDNKKDATSDTANNSIQVGASALTNAFLDLAVREDKDEVLMFLQKNQREGETIRNKLTEIVLTLDSVYKHRKEGGGYVDVDVLAHATVFSDDELEMIITILSAGILSHYSHPETGPQLAVLRVTNFLGKRRI